MVLGLMVCARYPVRSAVARVARRGLLGHRRGAVATEFAILAIPLFTMLLGVMELGYDFFVQAALDSAVETAARSVQVGAVQCGASSNSAAILKAVCPSLSPLLSCNLLTLNVQEVGLGTGTANYYNTTPPNYTTSSNSGNSVNTGAGGDMMLLQAWYAGPTFIGTLVPNFAIVQGGRLIHQTYASAAFVDEYFTSTTQTAGQCS